MDVPYDVAMSLLSGDEPLAVRIHNELTENLHVFVYSKRQEELAGTDGLESFRKAFLSESRLVVVLYRDGWGKTKWTAVEELAIKDRIFDGGWDSLLFVMLDEKATPPAWLPKTHIRLNYGSYGDDLIGAIKMRSQELGSSLKIESAVERATRAQANELMRVERERLLASQGLAALQAEHLALRQELNQKLEEIETQLTAIKVDHGDDGDVYLIRTEEVSLNFYLYIRFPVTASRIVVQEFDAPQILPKDRAHYVMVRNPRSISKEEFYFDYNQAHGWCWRTQKSGSKEALLSTVYLAEHLIKRLFEVHELFRSGRMTRYEEV